MKEIIGYVRVSTNEQVEKGLSLEDQELQIGRYTELYKLGDVRIVKDEGKSGKDLNREGIREVIGLAKGKRIAHLIVAKLDRLSRNTLDQLTLAQLFKQNGVELHSIAEKVDTSSASGQLYFTITAAFAQFERDKIAERTKEALQFRKESGLVYGQLPWGWKREGKQLVEDKGERSILRRVKKLSSRGLSLRKIAGKLNSESLTTKKGRSWTHLTVMMALKAA